MGPKMGPIPHPIILVFLPNKNNIPNLEVGNMKEKVLHFQLWHREIALRNIFMF
jgi:hypothetical protein